MQTRNLIFKVLLLLLTTPLFAQVQIKVTTANVNLRKGPGIDNNIICTIPLATTLTIDSLSKESQEWTKVTYLGKTGYVNSKYLSNLKLKNSLNNGSGFSNTSSYVKYYTNSKGEKVQSPTYYKMSPQERSTMKKNNLSFI
jgi:uncharacterized protein YgiM (DUF1202 family)